MNSETTLDDLERWMALPTETEKLEFKEAKSNFSATKLAQYSCALANEGGGHLLLGVSDKKPRRVVGSAVSIKGTSEAKILESVGVKISIDELEHANGRVVVVKIPSRPMGVPLSFDGKYLMRAGEALVSMSHDKLKSIIDEGKESFEKRIALDSLRRDDVFELLDIQTYYRLLKQAIPTNPNSQIDKLQTDDLVILDNSSGLLAITNLGALLLARDLGKFEELKYKAPRFVVYDGSDKLSHKTDITGNKGYAVGFEGLFEYIMERVPVNIELVRAIRSNNPVYPPDAVREILANAMIHQDFDSGSGNVTIELYEDRFEVKNPGEPIISTDRFIDESKSRNQALAYLMRRFGFCEEMGSGIDKVITAIEVYQLPALSVTIGLDSTSVCLYKYKAFSDMSQQEKSDACYQHCVLRFITKQKTNNQSVRERFKLDNKQTTTVSRILGDCVEDGKIKLEDPEKTSRKYVNYVPFWA